MEPHRTAREIMKIQPRYKFANFSLRCGSVPAMRPQDICSETHRRLGNDAVL